MSRVTPMPVSPMAEKEVLSRSKSNQSMVSEVRDILRQSPRLDVRAVREEADPHGADLPRNKSGLGRPPGSHGDIGVAPKEVLN